MPLLYPAMYSHDTTISYFCNAFLHATMLLMKEENSVESLAPMRHTLAHLLGAAVLELYPDSKLTLGPAIDNGFYYDFAFGETRPTEADLPKIEAKMRSIVQTWSGFTRQEVSADEASKQFADNPYKLELINEFSAEGQTLTIYSCGGFEDLCRGGHTEHPDKELRHFKLLSLAGAYWRGSEKNKMLTRIYGTAWPTKDELMKHLLMLEEAKKRDHRKLGVELDLFVLSDLVGAGLPLFTPRGTILRDEVNDYLWQLNKQNGYQKVDIPHLAKPDLYKVSGHWEKYKDDGFQVHGRDKHYMLKPMNCPHHTQIYASRARSYRDLPIRYFDTTKVYRDENSGELLGISRVISITQDDGHVFCRPDQIGEETAKIVGMIKSFYSTLGMLNEGSYRATLSVRDPKTPDKYLGDTAVWNMAEKRLEEIGQEQGLSLTRAEGEAAFYGPKLDFMFKDAIGREWQLATIQLDFVQPKRFDLEFIDDTGTKVTPVMIHRAISGSIERFLSVMIEHYAGAFPLWLSPVQVKVLPISEKHNEYGMKVLNALRTTGLRAEIDDANESLGKKIRNAKTEKVPYIFVVGEKEESSGTVGVETRAGSEGAQPLDVMVTRLVDE